MEETEAGVQTALEAFFADADQVTISEKDGVQSFSATFDLTKRKDDGSTTVARPVQVLNWALPQVANSDLS